MITVGTIGTSQITEAFLEAMSFLPDTYRLQGVYSRNVSKAKSLAKQFGATYYCDDLAEFWADPELDLVYVASPNALHFDQVKEAIRSGKHVLVEKPMFASVEEWQEAHTLARAQGVLLFEGVLHIHNQNYKRLKQLVNHKRQAASQPFLGAHFSLGQYSSRYPAYLTSQAAGEPAPNIFNPAFAGGTLMDLGIYPLYVIVDLFGLPERVKYSAIQGPNGIDLFGNAVLYYGQSQISLMISKGVYSVQASEIYIDDEVIAIEDITRIRRVSLANAKGEQAVVSDYQPKHAMLGELQDFAQVLEASRPLATGSPAYERYRHWTSLSYQVAQVMAAMRQSANLTFNQEENEVTL